MGSCIEKLDEEGSRPNTGFAKVEAFIHLRLLIAGSTYNSMNSLFVCGCSVSGGDINHRLFFLEPPTERTWGEKYY